MGRKPIETTHIRVRATSKRNLNILSALEDKSGAEYLDNLLEKEIKAKGIKVKGSLDV